METIQGIKETIQDINSQIEELANQAKMLDEKLGKTYTELLNIVASENPNKPKKIGKGMYIMKHSDLIGNPWTPVYFDWEESAKVILDFLKSKPKTEWHKILKEMLNKNKGKIIMFQDVYYVNGYRYVNNQPINRKFIELLFEKM